jgi:hypothetical protein
MEENEMENYLAVIVAGSALVWALESMVRGLGRWING